MRKRKFFTNLFRCPKARTTKIVWAALGLLILNLVYVNKDVLLATETWQYHAEVARDQDMLKEISQIENGLDSDEQTAKEHGKQPSNLRLYDDVAKTKARKSPKPDGLIVKESMRSRIHPDQDKFTVEENRTSGDNLNSDKDDVVVNAHADHGLMSTKSAVEEKRDRGDDPKLDGDVMNYTGQIPNGLVSNKHTKRGRDSTDHVKTDNKKTNQDTQAEFTGDDVIARMKQLLFKPPEWIRTTIFDVCPKACRAMSALNISKELPFMNVERIDIDPKSVSLNDPPIPIIGTDQVHQRMVSGVDVAEFMAHVTMWRKVFHGSGGIGVFLSCQVKDAVPLLKTLRNDKWFRNETEDGEMGNEKWDILLLGAGRRGAVPRGSIEKGAVPENRIADEDVLGYAVSQTGANELLRHVRAFTVPTRAFMSIIVETGLKVLRWDGAGLGEVRACTGSTGERKESSELPFYPPVHWIHAAARDRQR